MPLNSCGSVSARLSVWFSDFRRSRKRRQIGLQHIDAARVELLQCFSPRTRYNDARRLVPASVSTSVPLVNVEQRQTDASRALDVLRAPAQTPRDHQVQNQEQIVLQREHDPLADAAQADHERCLSLPRSAASTERNRNGLSS